MGDCTRFSNRASKRLECPVCHTPGQPVSVETVKSLVKHPSLATMENPDFFICLTSNCEAVYFDQDAVFRQKDVVVPVAYKAGTHPKFICYCNRVTEEDIIGAIVNGGAKTIGDIARLTGAMNNGKCLTANPKGICCHRDIEDILQRAVNKV